MDFHAFFKLFIFIELDFKGFSLSAKQGYLCEIFAFISLKVFPDVKRDWTVLRSKQLFYHFLSIHIFIIKYFQWNSRFLDFDPKTRVFLAYQLRLFISFAYFFFNLTIKFSVRVSCITLSLCKYPSLLLAAITHR